MTSPHPAGYPEARRGALYGVAAYLLWGLFPLYFLTLEPSTAWEILGHRILWTFVFCLGVLVARRDLAWLPRLLADRSTMVRIVPAAMFIAVNWTLYVVAVVAGHVSEAALGYFLNPLVTVALGVLVLRERLRPGQWAAVGIGALAGLVLVVGSDRVPWISFALATSFALYSLLKNRLGAQLPALHGLTVEAIVLLPAALALLGATAVTGVATFSSNGVPHSLLLLLAGPVTATPLLFFAAAARRVPLVTIGLLQFLAPVIQLLIAVLIGEHIEPVRWVGFGFVWLALVVLSTDSLRQRRARVPASEPV